LKTPAGLAAKAVPAGTLLVRDDNGSADRIGWLKKMAKEIRSKRPSWPHPEISDV